MIKLLIFGAIMFGLGFAYGRDESLFGKTIEFAKKVYEKIVELIKKIVEFIKTKTKK